MNKINWKVRFRNPLFIAQIVLAIITPILAYMGMNVSDLTSWSVVGTVIFEAIKNPYVLCLVIVSIYNATIDPTTKGVGDSQQALQYEIPKDDKIEM